MILGWLVALLPRRARSSGCIALLFVRRDLGAAYVFVAGLICGIVSAIISAPISADRLRRRHRLAAPTSSSPPSRRPATTSRIAVLKQGLLSDPIDKTLTFFVVFAILGALSRRFVARFPQGEQAVGLAEA